MDEKSSISELEQMATAGDDAAAQANLGRRYLHGDGVEQDFSEAYRWLSKAASQGQTKASCDLGTMYQLGIGVERNVLAAADFHLIAAEEGDSQACQNLGEYQAELQEIALSGSQMASLFMSRICNRGFVTEKSQALTWTWILWAKKHCEPDADAEIAGEVTQAYDFYRKSITKENRDEGKKVLAELQASRLHQPKPADEK
jgi:TPR repeat protein